MAERDKFYITTAISYPNGAPHIGHAYEVIAADAIARFKRIDGYDVFFMTGTDEHGLKIQQTATREGKSPKAFVDEMASKFRAMGERLNCSFDRFIRTTDADHLASTQELWRRMQANGDIYLSKYAGWYSVRDEAYYDESELTKAPDGELARADRARRSSGSRRRATSSASRPTRTGSSPTTTTTPTFIGPETRRNEIVSFVRGGLQDLSISRTTFDWGLPVPGDPKHVMYVWVDALNNYLTGDRLPRRELAALALLAGRRPHHRQGHRPLPRGLLAGLPDVGRPAAAEARLRPRLPVQPRREDVEVGRQRHRPVRARRRLRRRPAALLLPARGAVRPGRQLLARGDRQPHQRRPRERSRQPRPALAVDDRAQLRRRGAGAGRARPTPTRRSSRRRARCRRRRGRRCSDFALHTVLAEIWAVVAEANRYFASQEPWVLRKQDPARMGTVLYVTAETAAHRRHPGAALRPERGREAPRPPRRRRPGERLLARIGAGACASAGRRAPETGADFPALRRGGRSLSFLTREAGGDHAKHGGGGDPKRGTWACPRHRRSLSSGRPKAGPVGRSPSPVAARRRRMQVTAPWFMFATGIENSYPTIDNGRKRVDEMEKCGHYEHWRTDFELVQDLDIRFLRYGPPIHTTWLGAGPLRLGLRRPHLRRPEGDRRRRRSSTSAISACRTGSATSRTRTSPSSSPATPAPSPSASRGCSSTRR